MRYSLNILGIFLKFFGLLMLVPVICSLIYGQDDLNTFLISSLVTIIFGILLQYTTKPDKQTRDIDRKSGFLIVSLCWIGASLFGSIPYLVYGVFENPADAFFESVSGFTTTGATVLADIEVFPQGILFWRNFTQWLGGMGIILLAIAILPKLSVGGMQLMGHEVSEHKTEKITPRIAETAKKLWIVYVILSVILCSLLFLAGMPVFDSILHTFTTIATGGFSPMNQSVGAYDIALVDAITTVFMFVGGINFVLLYYLFAGRFSNIFKNSDLKFYFFLNLGAIAVVTFILWGNSYHSILESLRYASFQVISISTGTGYSTADFDLWPNSTRFILLALMFAGASAGSTTGALKTIRILVLVKTGYREVKKLIYPRGVFPIRIDNHAVSENIVSSISSFFILYIFIAVVSAVILLILEDLTIVSALSASAATLGTVGPGLDQVGPTENYSFLGSGTKVFLSLLMIIGRLELYAILVLLTPAFWKK